MEGPPHTIIPFVGSFLTLEEERAILRAAVERWPDNRDLLAVEEMAELSAALMHLRRGKVDISAVYAEMADVFIMLEQLMGLFGNPPEVLRIRAAKLRRLEAILRGEEKK